MLGTARGAKVVEQSWILMHTEAAYRQEMGEELAEWWQWDVPSSRDLGRVWCFSAGHQVSPQLIPGQAECSGVGQSPGPAEAVAVLPV